MRDIAREAGTSAVTVSKALGGQPGMSDETRNRILQIAQQMGYEYPGGERLAQKQSLDIGILIPDRYFEAESFYALLYKELVKKLADQGHFGVLELLKAEDEASGTLPNLVRSGKVKAMILLGEPGKAYYRMIAQCGIPVLFLDFYDEQANADAVTCDNTYGTYRLTSHLIRLGHRRIGFVGNMKATSSIMDRFLGYYRAMLVNDLPVEDRWILSDREKTGGLKLQELPEELPDAFVCNCDLTARLLIDRLKERGIRVPEDISVTGFDDYPPGSNDDIGLSTFRVDTEAMMELAIKTILERCAGSRKPFGRTVIGGQPVYRVSG